MQVMRNRAQIATRREIAREIRLEEQSEKSRGIASRILKDGGTLWLADQETKRPPGTRILVRAGGPRVAVGYCSHRHWDLRVRSSM